jgi:hypothetical protein
MLLAKTAVSRGIKGATMNVCTNTMKAAAQIVGSIHRGMLVVMDSLLCLLLQWRHLEHS